MSDIENSDTNTPPPPPEQSSPQPPVAGGTPGAEERQWAMFAHLSALVGGILTAGWAPAASAASLAR